MLRVEDETNEPTSWPCNPTAFTSVSVSPQMFPATHAVADYPPVPLDDEFALGLGLIIDGLAKMRVAPGALTAMNNQGRGSAIRGRCTRVKLLTRPSKLE